MFHNLEMASNIIQHNIKCSWESQFYIFQYKSDLTLMELNIVVLKCSILDLKITK